MELLAPAGTLETFHGALDAGADAVYVGAPEINARSLSRDFRFDEIGAMISICRARKKKLYLAANSLLREQDLPDLIKSLAILEALQPDGLIVQDMGLIKVVNKYFPNLSLHASTLMAAHNSDCVEMFAAMGCERVVLARELTLKEITSIAASTDTELEVFVHGAMCFSYSGYCLFSSFHGGKSGLRGRCVQPCRRRYDWDVKGKKKGRGKKAQKGKSQSSGSGYLFSMNDLSGLDAVAQLKKIGIASLKIEGRLRTVHYVSSVVQAYRQVIDAGDHEIQKALESGARLIEGAMSRKVSSGYFHTPQPTGAITPYHSGNMGLHLGQLLGIKQVDDEWLGQLLLKVDLQCGDRLRCHFEATGERKPFTVKKIFVQDEQVNSANAGMRVNLSLPPDFPTKIRGRVEVYKVDVRTKTGHYEREDVLGAARQQIRKIKLTEKQRIKRIQQQVIGSIDQTNQTQATAKGQSKRFPVKKGGKKGKSVQLPLECWLKIDTITPIFHRLPFKVDRFILTIDNKNISQAGKIKRYLGQSIRNLIWSLPPVLLEQELGRMRKLINTLSRSGYRNFQIAHISQADLFQDKRVHLCGDYSLNLMNHQATIWAETAGLEATQLSIELDHHCLKRLITTYKLTSGGNCRLGLTVYGTPPLFTARLAPNHFQYNRGLKSPKQEMFVIKKKRGFTQTFAKRPFSLLPYLHELKSLGLDYVVIDLANMNSGKKELQNLADMLSGKTRFPKLPTFNYLGKLE